MSKRITMVAPINAFTGYGLHALEIFRGMERRGWFVAVRPTGVDEAFARAPAELRQRFVGGPQPEPWELLLHPPNMLPTPGKKTVFFTMWESTRMRSGGVQMLNKADVVVVPCAWNASCFSAEGVDKPIRIVPLGIDTGIFHQRAPMRVPSEDDPPVIFGTAARAKHGGIRKGLQDVVELFREAFPVETDVRLRVKCFADDPEVKIDDERVQITRAFMGHHELSDWYARLDAFVSMSRGEGWGLMQQQAMSVGRPVIAARYGGLAEFMTEDNSYCVDFHPAAAGGGYAGMGMWANPSRESVIEKLRWVHRNRGEAEARGARASQSVSHLTWDHSIGKLAGVLDEFGV
jgi:glycosyltransferase involved in cell wall biosynthesis